MTEDAGIEPNTVAMLVLTTRLDLIHKDILHMILRQISVTIVALKRQIHMIL